MVREACHPLALVVEAVHSVVQDPASFVVVPASLVLSAGDTRRVPHLPPAIEMT